MAARKDARFHDGSPKVNFSANINLWLGPKPAQKAQKITHIFSQTVLFTAESDDFF
jgi:hypothetical protein